MSDPSRAKPDRREFLMRLGLGAGIAGVATQGVASLRSLVPNVSYDAPTTVKLGPPGEFPEGMKFLSAERLFVFRQGNTFHAISAVCTHLGCTVRAEALSQPVEREVGGARLRLVINLENRDVVSLGNLFQLAARGDGQLFIPRPQRRLERR